MNRLAILSAAFAVLATTAFAADELVTPAGPNGPAVTADDFAWMAGRWTGDGLGGKVEELFSPPSGGQMVGHFRSWNDKGPAFYEFECICAAGQTLVYRVKHFNPDFHGWEEKNAYHDFPLLSIDGDSYTFDGLVIRRLGNDAMRHTVTLKQKDGTVEEIVLNYRRAP